MLLFHWIDRMCVMLVLVIFVTCAFICFGGKEDRSDQLAFDREAIEELMDFIGMTKVARDSIYNFSINYVYNNHVVGIEYSEQYFFVQSLEDPGPLIKFEATEGDWAYIRTDGQIGSFGLAAQISYFKDGCIYLNFWKDQVHQICTDGSHRTLLKGEERKNMQLAQHMLYYKGKIIIQSHSGLFIFYENTGELIYKSEMIGSLSFSPTIIGNKLIFGESSSFPPVTTTLVCLNLDDLTIEWEKFLEGQYIAGGVGGRRFPNDGENLFAFYSYTDHATGIINISSEEITYLDSFRPSYYHDLGGFFYTNFFNPFTGTDIIGGRNGHTVRIDTQTGEIKWQTRVSFSFIYNDFVVSRIMKKEGRYYTTDQLVVLNIHTGEVEKKINVNIRDNLGGLFKIREQYILVGDTFYK